MIDSKYLMFTAIAAIVVTIMLAVFADVAGQLSGFQAWCDAHNGTMQATGQIYCELPNGTAVGPREVPT